MSAAGVAKAKTDALANGAKPRPEGRVRERGWRPTRKAFGIAESRTEAARRRATAPRPTLGQFDQSGPLKEAEA
jgi:hypothetical protein